MNAIAALSPRQCDGAADWFYDVIAKERDTLSSFMDVDQAGLTDIIAMLAAQSRPVIFTGIGKSGHICAKLAATFSSLGTAAVFMNAAEAVHGDLGAVEAGSVVVVLSNSGSTDEIMRILPLLKARGCINIGIIGRAGSPLSRAVDHLILAEIDREADHIGMAPTSSTTLHLAIGDALAVAVSRMRGFTRDKFLEHHPAGLLGRRMIPVAAVMRQGDDLPLVNAETDLLDLLAVMSSKRMGAACVVGDKGQLLGLVVDGDVRRHLQAGPKVAGVNAGMLMQTNPQKIHSTSTLGDVLVLRQSASLDWLVLPVVDHADQLMGMIHLNDVQG